MMAAPYKLIELTKESRNKQRSVDFVPRSWIKYDQDIGTLVTKFMPPPYDGENAALLHSLIECRAPAPENWPEFPIDIRGEATCYAEAVKKLKVLGERQYVYSTDTEQTAKDKAVAATREYKSQVLEQDEGNSWGVPELIEDKIPSRDHVSSDSAGRNKTRTQKSKTTKGNDTENSKVQKLTSNASQTLGKARPSSGNTKSQKKVSPEHHKRSLPISSSHKESNSKALQTKEDNNKGTTDALSQLLSNMRSSSPGTSNLSEIEGSKASPPKQHNDGDDDDVAISNGNSEASKTTSNKNTGKAFLLPDNAKEQKKATPQESVSDTLPDANSQNELNNNSQQTLEKITEAEVAKTILPQKISDDLRDANSTTTRKTTVSKPSTSMGEPITNSDAGIVLFDDFLSVVNPPETLNEIKLLVAKGFRSQSIQLTRISTQLEEIKMLMKESKIGNPGAIRVDEFTNKWNLALPIKILENFQIFDEKLTVDEAFREDSVSTMWGTADASLPVTNSVRGILKKFMPRDLTQHYTTVKNTGKLVFCKTKFYSCVQAVIVSKYKENKDVSPISDKDFEHAVGKVMNNAKDWEGYRTARSKK